VAIRMKEPSQADLIRKRLMNIKMRLYATPEYLEQHGTPLTMEDFNQHRLICQHAGTAQVSAGAMLVAELMSHDIPSTFTVNNYFGVLQGVLNHLGIGVLPDYITEDFPHLVRVLPETESSEVPVFLAYPEELRHSKRVAAFRETRRGVVPGEAREGLRMVASHQWISGSGEGAPRSRKSRSQPVSAWRTLRW
jgi:DNA-binding transcriptional LysR family regulator